MKYLHTNYAWQADRIILKINTRRYAYSILYSALGFKPDKRKIIDEYRQLV